jgi:hypothetical protein
MTSSNLTDPVNVIYQPTFVLKKIDPIQIHQHYASGKYTKFTLQPIADKVSVEAAVVPSLTGGTHTFRDKNNCVILIHTTNNQSLKSLPSFKPRCFWCMQDLSFNTDTHVPLPTKVQRLVTPETTYYDFDADGMCCSFECGLAFLRHFKEGGGVVRSYNNETREIVLQTLYRLCHPEAPDFRLLSCYGGTMTIDEFRLSKSLFVPLPNILIRPVSQQFVVQKPEIEKK